jgi:dolichyl-phosphate-mannose-protein mannosyltransferase
MHLFVRVFALILIPTAIYLGSFYAHFAILNQSGPGDTYMTIETQNELRGIEPVDTPLGKVKQIKNNNVKQND